jgi:hypothetical protein
MDEIAGYCPPSANPPSKAPLITLMKQARAFGLGVLLATQNPVYLDYKGLSNAGTWFIGRLQTERDKLRVLDGLEGAATGASAGFDRAALDPMLSSLGNRVFLMNNVHEDAPEVFEVRWVMSYLRGPLTRDQIRTLMEARISQPAGGPQTPDLTSRPAPSPRFADVAEAALTARPPVLPPGITQRFIAARAGADERLVYRPMLLGRVRVYYGDAKAQVDQERTTSYLIPFGESTVVNWDAAAATVVCDPELETAPADGAGFASLPPEAGQADSYPIWEKRLVDHVYRTEKLELMHCPSLKLISRPQESESAFRLRLGQRMREERDALVEKLRARYAPKLAALQDRIRRAEQALAVQAEQSRQAKMSTMVSLGTAVLSAVFGRKLRSSGHVTRAGTAVRGVGRSMREAGDVGRAEENLAALQAQLAELDREFNMEVNEAAAPSDSNAEPLETLPIRPKKSGISVQSLVLAWAPHVAADGRAAWDESQTPSTTGAR